MAETELLDIDLDTLSMEDIEDIAEIMPLPTGAYTLQGVSFEQKEAGDHPLLEVKFKIVSVNELKNKELAKDEKVPEEGSETSFGYVTDNKFGLGSLKELLRPVAVQFGTSKVPDLLNILADGTQLNVIIKRTYNKDRERYYAKIKKVTLA